MSCPDPKKIHVGIPSFFSSDLVSTMSDQSLVLLAAIAKHDSLSQVELTEVSSISATVVRKCLKEAIDKELLWIDIFDRFRISSRAQYVIDYYLMGKNFLYE